MTSSDLSRAANGTRLAVLTVCLAAGLPYLSTLDNYFVADDFGVVQLLSQKPAFYFPRWFISSWMEGAFGATAHQIRPFTALTYQLTALWNAESPLANHLLNITIHAANGLLVLTIANRVAALSLPAAAFAATMFVLLPAHAETVAWVTGRVDSLPVTFYLASFLMYARWRIDGSQDGRLYAGSVALFFLALFSKETTTTMLMTLLLYDVLVTGQARRISWVMLRPYLPYAALTVAFLLLRYALFGDVVQESQLPAGAIPSFGDRIGRHLQRAILGDVTNGPAIIWTLLFVVSAAVLFLWSRSATAEVRRTAVRALYFGPVWWLVGVIPTLVALYESPRHVYLASIGWALIAGFAVHVVWSTRAWRMTLALTAAVLFIHVLALQTPVTRWNVSARVSERAAMDLEREALSAPEGTLMLVSAPVRSWEWAIPYVAQPPFAQSDLTRRVSIVSPWLLHCCRSQWLTDTRTTLKTWLSHEHGASIIVLHWDAQTGSLSKLTDAEFPALRTLISILAETDTIEALDGGIRRITDQLAARPVSR